jgi:hypothetical protein
VNKINKNFINIIYVLKSSDLEKHVKSQETIIKKYFDTHKLVLALQINLSNLLGKYRQIALESG